MDRVPAIEHDRLGQLLHEGASGLYINEAAVRLLHRHGYWLRRPEFFQFVDGYGDPVTALGIRWADAVAALDRGELAADQEPANILRVAASLCTFYEVSFRDVCERISREGIKHVAEAVMYADGFLDSVADPRP